MERFLGNGTQVKATSITGDSGGGGKVQLLGPAVKELKVMPADGKIANCGLHAGQKMIENPTKETLGDVGNGKVTPSQLLYSTTRLWSTIRKQGGMKLLDEIWNVVKKTMIENEEWKKLGEKAMKIAWLEVMDEAAKFDEYSEEEFAAMSDFVFKAPRGLQEPTWSRWQSVSYCYCIAICSSSQNVCPTLFGQKWDKNVRVRPVPVAAVLCLCQCGYRGSIVCVIV